MKAVTVDNPFDNGKETVTVRSALVMSAVYLAQARYLFNHLPDPSLWPIETTAHAAKGQLAASIGEGYAVLADTLGKDPS